MLDMQAIAAGRQLLSGLLGVQDRTDQFVNRIKHSLDSGHMDPNQVQERLLTRFGDAALGIVADDGTVDFARISELAVQQGGGDRAQRMETRPAQDAGMTDSTPATRAAALRERLQTFLGDEAAALVGEDGSVDFEGLVAFLAERNRPETAYLHTEAPTIFDTRV